MAERKERGESTPCLRQACVTRRIKARDVHSLQVRRARGTPFFNPGFLPGPREAWAEVWGPLPEWARPVSVSPPTLAAQTSSVGLDLSERKIDSLTW